MIIAGNNYESSTVLVAPDWGGTTSTIVPGFAFPGGKKRLQRPIVNYMPKSGGTYSEPCVGRGNVFWKAATILQFSHWHLNDLRTAPFLNAIISHGRTIEVPEHTRAEFELQKSACQHGDPTALLLEPYLSFSGAGYAAGFRPTKGSPLRHHYQNTLSRAHDILMYTPCCLIRKCYPRICPFLVNSGC